jgi:hypothetical protein
MSYPCLSKAQDLYTGLRGLQPAPGTRQVAACYVTIRSCERCGNLLQTVV